MKSLNIKKGTRIVVAMSGGVDSSVTAAYLKFLGYDVIGISLQLHDMSNDKEHGSCCSLSDIYDARKVAEKINIPFYVANMEEKFQNEVINNFIEEYKKGNTPNPCVKCNEKVKFSFLMDWALDLGAEYLATGHYALIQFNEISKQYELLKGEDPFKDQSYFLFTLKQNELEKTLFPIGELSKSQVRELASHYGLSVYNKPDSQEICFVQSKSYKDFLKPYVSLQNGNMVDMSGNILGTHQGIHQFTIGQRKGLGSLGSTAHYVVDLRPQTNEVVVGTEEHLYKKECTVTHINWMVDKTQVLQKSLKAKIRYRSKESPVSISCLSENKISVRFEMPQRAITPGQALVLYENNRVVGGGWIDKNCI